MKHLRALSMLLLLCALASCGETAAPSSDTTAGDSTAGEETTAAPYEVRDLGGREFTILAREAEGSQPCEIFVEEETGDVLSDAIYRRNMAVEDALHVKLSVVTATRKKMGEEVLTFVMSGDPVFDIGFVNYGTVASILPVDGALVPFEDISTLDLSAPWWDAQSLDAFRITDSTYLASGALNLNTSLAIYGILFNQPLVEDLKLDQPYTLVTSGKWTMDKMYKMMQTAHRDLDGDSVITDKDQYGMICTDNGFQYLFYHAGEELVSKSSEGKLEINRSTRLYDAVDALLPLNVMSVRDTDANNMRIFTSGNALFYQTGLQTTMSLRTMAEDYGVIPGPKADEAQAEYASPLAASFVSLTCVPATNDKLEDTGILLNALGYHSDEILMPALYESVLPAKLARDEASTQMIDIMYDSKIYVINAAFNFGKSNSIFQSLRDAGTNTMSSLIASYTPAIEASIADLMAKLK